jgi:hypothetical protein
MNQSETLRNLILAMWSNTTPEPKNVFRERPGHRICIEDGDKEFETLQCHIIDLLNSKLLPATREEWDYMETKAAELALICKDFLEKV